VCMAHGGAAWAVAACSGNEAEKGARRGGGGVAALGWDGEGVEAGNGGGYGALLAHPWRTSGETEKGKEGNGDRRRRFKGDDDDSGFASAFANLTTRTAARPSVRSAVKDTAVSRASTLLLGTVAS
jgi:hypothetical protein